MRSAVCSLRSLDRYSQSAPILEVKKNSETHDQFDERTWRLHAHLNPDDSGTLCIPATAFSNCIKTAALKLGKKVKGRGAATYGKFFQGGVMVTDPLPLPKYRRETVTGEKVYVHANPSKGERAGRVWRTYPKIDAWSGDVTFLVLDQVITEEVFRETLIYAGQVIGIGRFRPENRGYYGRFALERMVWTDE